ncbi:hypothetical protein Nmel_008340, partial [Mimus melanotis]
MSFHHTGSMILVCGTSTCFSFSSVQLTVQSLSTEEWEDCCLSHRALPAAGLPSRYLSSGSKYRSIITVSESPLQLLLNSVDGRQPLTVQVLWKSSCQGLEKQKRSSHYCRTPLVLNKHIVKKNH